MVTGKKSLTVVWKNVRKMRSREGQSEIMNRIGLVGSVYMNCEGVRKEDNILKLDSIKGVVWRALEDGLSIMI